MLQNYSYQHINLCAKNAVIILCYCNTIILACSELLETTCRVANVLKQLGVKKHDVVIIYMPAMPLAVASMLACARIGAVHR